MPGIKILEGKIFTSIVVSKNKKEIRFVCNTGEKYLMYHEQD